MQFIDTHSHIYLDHFQDDINEVITRCHEKNVSRIYLPNIDLESIPQIHSLVKKHPDMMFPMMGLHPCSVKENYKEVLKKIEHELDQGNYVGVGEIGIDLYWDKTHIPEQIDAFQQQCKWAMEKNLPIIIHVRDSFPEIFHAIDEIYTPKLFGIFHCFTGGEKEAKKIISYKTFKMGLGGVLTFKNSQLPNVVKNIPLEYLLLETDSPYLTPTPHRGKRNESSYTYLVANKLAEIKGITLEEVADITTQNAMKIFHHGNA